MQTPWTARGERGPPRLPCCRGAVRPLLTASSHHSTSCSPLTLCTLAPATHAHTHRVRLSRPRLLVTVITATFHPWRRYEVALVPPLISTLRALSDEASVILVAYDENIGRRAAYAAVEAQARRWFGWREVTPEDEAREAHGQGVPGAPPPPHVRKEGVRIVQLQKRREPMGVEREV